MEQDMCFVDMKEITFFLSSTKHFCFLHSPKEGAHQADDRACRTSSLLCPLILTSKRDQQSRKVLKSALAGAQNSSS